MKVGDVKLVHDTQKGSCPNSWNKVATAWYGLLP